MPKVCVSGGEAGRDSPREGDREARAAIEAERTGNWQERDRMGRGGPPGEQRNCKLPP